MPCVMLNSKWAATLRLRTRLTARSGSMSSVGSWVRSIRSQSAAQWNVVGIQREQNSALGMLETVGKESEPTVPTLFDKNWQNRFGIDYPGVRHEPEGVRRGIGRYENAWFE